MERGRGRLATTPSEIPATGWKDILWRVYGRITECRVIAVAAGVTFYALLAIFPAIAALISINDLLFGRRDPTYIIFDVLFVEGEDVRAAPLKERKALLDKIVGRYGLERTEPFFGEGRPLFSAVCKLDLEGIVVKRLADPYEPERTKWWKVLNPNYSQKEGRSELFERRYA